MKHQPKKHFDISKPPQRGPDPTSKPIIVGHHPLVPDPMIKEGRDKAAKPIKVFSDGESPEPLNSKPPEPAKKTSAADILPDLSDVSRPHETAPAPIIPASAEDQKPGLTEPDIKPHASASGPQAPAESAPGAIFSPLAAPDDSVGPAESTPASMPIPVPADQTVQPGGREHEPPTPSEPPAGQELHIPAGRAVVHHKPRVWVWILMALVILAWAYAAVDVLSGIKLPYEFFKNSS